MLDQYRQKSKQLSEVMEVDVATITGMLVATITGMLVATITGMLVVQLHYIIP